MQRIRYRCVLAAALLGVLSGCGPAVTEEESMDEALAQSSSSLGSCPSNYTCGPWLEWRNTGVPYCSSTTPMCRRECVVRPGSPLPFCTFYPGPGISQGQQRMRFCTPPWTPPSPICTDYEYRETMVSCGAC